MKTIKKKLPNNDVFDAVEIKDQNKYLRQIAYRVGYFIFEFNDLDNTLTNILGLHIGGGDTKVYEHIFLSGISINQKIVLLDRHYRFELAWVSLGGGEESDKAKVKRVIDELKEISNLRNTIVHANYYSLDSNGNIKAKTKFADSDVEENWVTITRDFLVESINQIRGFINALEEFDEQFH